MSFQIKIKEAWPFFIGVIVVLFFQFSVTGVNLKYFPGDLGDARFNTYLLEHAHQYFTGEIDDFWNAPFMYPEKEVISYSDNLLGSAPFYSIFRSIGIDRETAFQCWFILMGLLNFGFCYLFLKAVFKNKYTAVVGALIFSISIALHSQLTHAQVFPRFPIPIAFWLCFQFYKTFNPIYFLGILMTVVYQFYCGIYLGFLLVIPVTLVLLGILISKYELLFQNIKRLTWLAKMLISPIISVLAILPLMLPYLRRSALLNEEKTYDAIVASLPTIRSYFYVHNNGNSLWSFLSKTGEDYPAFYDHQIFVGGIGMLCMLLFFGSLIFIVLKRKSNQAFYLIIGFSALLSFALFTRYQGFSLYEYVFKIPGFEALRSLTRIINIFLIFFAFATAFVSNYFFSKSTQTAPIIFTVLVLIIGIDNYTKEASIYRSEKAVAVKRVDDLVDKMSHIPPQTVVSYEPLQQEDAAIFYQLDAMLASQQLHLKSLNGYSATSPVGFDSYWRNIDSTARNIWLTTKKFNQDSLIIIH
ncbi:MAG: hypothetical protein N4A35_03375 [Flavobacteriales bacterium]|jgi:hypothetical protein|nr:hypothetical protein [Flavobacteriales bacterium]